MLIFALILAVQFLTLILIVLKLTGVIAASWWVVVSPIIAAWLIGGVVAVVLLAVLSRAAYTLHPKVRS